MNSLHPLYARGRNLLLLTICLPKLLTVVALRGAARGNQPSHQYETWGASCTARRKLLSSEPVS